MPRIRRCLCTFAFLFAIAAASLRGQNNAGQSNDGQSNAGQSNDARVAAQVALAAESPRLLAAFPERPQPPFASGAPKPWIPISLTKMVSASGTIFAGTVTAISHSPASAKNSVASVAITFHVNHGMQGAITGQDFTLHQWIGLWSTGQQRYRIGDQVVLFLYPASKLGLTSCVAGSLGRFSIDNFGRVLLSPQHIAAFRTDPFIGGIPSMSTRRFAWAVRRASEADGVKEEGAAR
jgi:hypothetical protein